MSNGINKPQVVKIGECNVNLNTHDSPTKFKKIFKPFVTTFFKKPVIRPFAMEVQKRQVEIDDLENKLRQNQEDWDWREEMMPNSSYKNKSKWMHGVDFVLAIFKGGKSEPYGGDAQGEAAQFHFNMEAQRELENESLKLKGRINTLQDELHSFKRLDILTQDPNNMHANLSNTSVEVGPVRFIHTVENGENLKSIAEQRYGKTEAWRDLYDFNKDTIGNNPHIINPGTKLDLPYTFGDSGGIDGNPNTPW